jgi:DNA segregation ATPase FtsK/SpoIIIE, S-DNA-T family
VREHHHHERWCTGTRRETLRFLMVDPKMVELSVYNALPHLRHKVITDNRDAAAVLKWAVMEMQDRYRLLAENGCAQPAGLQQAGRARARRCKKPRPRCGLRGPQRLHRRHPAVHRRRDRRAGRPHDDGAGEVETPLAMLAQKARAIGIHLILATQRPSVNVITGLIKANFPCRIAFRVASQVDSAHHHRRHAGRVAARQRRHAVHPAGQERAVRLQGAFLSSEETEG